MKELVYIKNSDKLLFNIAPFIVIIASFMALSAVPFAKGLHAIDFDIGVLYVIAVSSLGVVGVLLAGWSSNNKYSLIGAMRSGAQIVSYELSVGLSLLTIIVLAGTMQFSELVQMQSGGWFIFRGHISALIAFVIFLIASTAETNRGPFDLAEAESELTAGYHTEYSGIKFAFFFLAEYMNMFLVASIAATVFLGGWMPFHISGWESFNHVMDFIPPLVWYFGKTAFIIWLMMWFKWTFPRLRIDQLLTLEWKYLLPINLFNILFMAFLVLMHWHF
jgi:NADH-quinone oxidoreductase subunit H